MKLTHGLAALVLLASASAAHAELTGTVTATTDYDFRGITQSAKGPALQGSIDYAHDSGFYAGAWASNVDFDDCCDESVEVDYYAGFAGGETLTYDVGLVYYTYPGAEYEPGGKKLNYQELYGALGYKWVEGKIWYSPDYGNADQSAMYYEANASFELPANFGLEAHVGYSDGDYWSDSEYTDWSVGVTYTLGHFDLALKWIDGSDLEDLDDFCKDVPGDCSGLDKDAFSTDAKAVFSVSTTFPWSDE
jgi:uncharacterized protein (TIGR02001 family)